ncbi:CoA binding domain-containing protein [Delphinella strobiligena]|nr:CoA binding domain-containing protein [Delphinella strobiligena]
MQTAAKAFFTSPRYAVAGASSNPRKFGYKIFEWYLQQSHTPTPINPRAPSISVSGTSYPAISSPSVLPAASETSLSVITPPSVTRVLLLEAKAAGVRAVWLQPGSFDAEGLEEAKRLFPGRAVGGGGDRHEGWCLLVHGVDAMEGSEEVRRSGKL